MGMSWSLNFWRSLGVVMSTSMLQGFQTSPLIGCDNIVVLNNVSPERLTFQALIGTFVPCVWKWRVAFVICMAL